MRQFVEFYIIRRNNSLFQGLISLEMFQVKIQLHIYAEHNRKSYGELKFKTYGRMCLFVFFIFFRYNRPINTAF